MTEDQQKYPERHLMGSGPIYDRDITDYESQEGVFEATQRVIDADSLLDPRENIERFDSGAVRDSQGGKSRPDFMDPRFLLRYGEHMRKGAEKYGDWNFTKGIPSSRYMASLQRHILKYYAGDRREDHLSAIVFNAVGIAMNEGTDLDDLHEW